MKKYHTYSEIMEQMDCWQKSYEIITDDEFKLGRNVFGKEYDEVIFFGCGSSYNIALSASFFTGLQTDLHPRAVPSSELFFNQDVYIKDNKKYLLVGFSRSGNTTETINVIKRYGSLKNVNTVVMTCRKDNNLSNVANYHYYCEGAEEEGIAMTKSFSTLLFSYCLMLSSFLGDKERIKGFSDIMLFLKDNINSIDSKIKEYVYKTKFNKFITLGSSFNYGLAVESNLKVKEMTQISSYSYYVMEFNHGPKSLIDDETLILFLTLNDSLTKNVQKIIKDYLEFKTKILIVGEKPICENKEISRIIENIDIENDIVRSFTNIPIFQLLSYYKTLELGLNPDKPRNLSFSIIL